MTKDPANPNDEKAAGTENQGVQGQAGRPSGPDRQEQYQRTREHAASGQDEQDRHARIRRRAHEIWEQEGRPEGLARQHWERAAQEIDQEDSKTKHEATEGGESDTKNSKSDPRRRSLELNNWSIWMLRASKNVVILPATSGCS
jgi:hypothetical protein